MGDLCNHKPPMFARKPIFLLISFLFSSAALAQQGQIQFSGIDLSDGLSHNQVNTIFKDSKGFIWFGTFSGLNRFDGHRIKIFKHDPRDNKSLSDDLITGIFELPDNKLYLETRNGINIYDSEKQIFIRDVVPYLKSLNITAKKITEVVKDDMGSFWFNAGAEGLFKYNTRNGESVHLSLKGNSSTTLSNSPVSTLQKGHDGSIWIIHTDKTIEMLNNKTGKVEKRISIFRQRDPSAAQNFKLFVDNNSDLWVYTTNNQKGIDFYETATGKTRFIDKAPNGLNNNLINSVIQDDKGFIWIGTDHGGVNLLDKKDFTIRYLINKEDDVKSIGQNTILALYKDQSGIIWVGTFKRGISFYHEKILKFPLYKHRNANPRGLTYDDVNRFAEDKLGNIWIGTNGGGLFYFNRKTGQFKRYVHEPGNPNSLSNDIIVSLYIDRADKLWIGTYFGGLNSFDGKNFKNYKHNARDPNSLTDDRVWDIMEDRRGNLWIATLGGGLDRMDRTKEVFIHKKLGDKNGIISNSLSCLMQDNKGSIWIGTSEGLDEMKIDGRFVHYKNKPGDKNTLINNVVYDVMQDSYGFIWVSTRDGLSRLDPESGRFRNFDNKDGLTEMTTLKVVEDNHKNLWVSTANGLFEIIVKKVDSRQFSYVFRKYDEHDGLQGNAFNANAGYKTKTGELLFGGANGFNLFKPENIRNDNTKPSIVLTDLQISNRSIGIDQNVDGRILLKKSIIFTKDLKLNHSQNGFTLEFAALNFFNPQKIKYRYKLEGFDQHWQELQPNNRRATYTNIDPGKYVFKVVSTDASGNWVDNETSLNITITPPFWRTTVAYIFYVLLVGGILLFIRHRGIQRIKTEFLIEQELQQAKRMHELDLLKIKFLTNVSHEFKTPLSLIITPLEKLIKQAAEAEKPQLQMMHRNGRRLLNLVNQLLDFRRMEVHELKLHPKTGDIILFIQELSLSFSDIADKKNISFSFQTDKKSFITLFDHDKIERILFNLLSNAFKFTPQGGKVKVSLHTAINEKKHTELILKVSDTGIGIPECNQERIFERFFQHDVPNSIVNQGSGIGLAITREFVRLHGGRITVDSKVHEGTEFKVYLEFRKTQVGEVISDPIKHGLLITPGAAEKKGNVSDSGLVSKSKKPILMLVEDNEDFRFYLKDNLKEYYQIAEAANGKDGWQKILSVHPDVIVSDVSMPGMSGIDLCLKIKADKRTAHIPVILLTALTTEDEELTGLETGASDYMTKPFNFEILLSRIRNLVQQQALSKKTYQKQVEFKPPETEVESVDDKFIRQVSFHIEKHLSDSAYTVDQLSADMNISRVGLYKKVLLLTGKSPVEYIRSYRLLKSKPLLLKSQMTIAEVAYEVGFSNPKHFSKYFKQEFNMLPSVYASTKPDQESI